ncbi:hypothetical protein ACL9RL_18330 [Plantibacter sp. Mn2098]|uniref:hypothetical protein n=1 Tax=Plantibacter sp. Mn2098 TaxID=3395266 RepID=UPI003BCF4E4B
MTNWEQACTELASSSDEFFNILGETNRHGDAHSVLVGVEPEGGDLAGGLVEFPETVGLAHGDDAVLFASR